MGQKRLNHVAILHVHQELLDDIDLVKITEEFIASYDSRREIFGKF